MYVIRMFTLKGGHCSFCGACQNSTTTGNAEQHLTFYVKVKLFTYHLLIYLRIASKIQVAAESHVKLNV